MMCHIATLECHAVEKWYSKPNATLRIAIRSYDMHKSGPVCMFFCVSVCGGGGGGITRG